MKTLALALAVTLIGQAASAEVIKAQCQVRWTKPGASRMGMRRLLIDTDAKTVKVWDNVGHGWDAKGSHAIVSADKDQIVLDRDPVKTSTLQRKGGAYAFHNNADKVTIQGRCRKVG